MQIDVDPPCRLSCMASRSASSRSAVDVTVLSHGNPGTYWDPPEPAEWETGDVHFYGKKIGDDPPRWEEHPLPDELKKWTDAYLEGDAAAETIGQHIADMQDDDY